MAFFSHNGCSVSQLLTQAQLAGTSCSPSFCTDRTGLWPGSERSGASSLIACFPIVKLHSTDSDGLLCQNDCVLCSKTKPYFGVGVVLLLKKSFAKLVSLSSEPQKLSCNTLTKLRHYLEFCN